MKQLAKLALALIPLVVAVGCGSKSGISEEAAETAVKGGKPALDGGAMGRGAAAERLGPEGGAQAQMGRPAQQAQRADEPSAAEAEAAKFAALLQKRKIYFDFDKSDIKPEFRDIILAHAKYLSENPHIKVTIEGHADERGTREYNMALGERRAFAVLRMLTLNGASRDQLKTISFGEERPEVEGHDESAWKWNRRAVLVYSE